MHAKGIVKNGVVILDAGADLPDGTPVIVSPIISAPERGLSSEEQVARWKELFKLEAPVADWEQMEREIIGD